MNVVYGGHCYFNCIGFCRKDNLRLNELKPNETSEAFHSWVVIQKLKFVVRVSRYPKELIPRGRLDGRSIPEK